MKILIDENEVMDLVIEHLKEKFGDRFNTGSLVKDEEYDSREESNIFKGYIVEITEK